MAAGTTPTLHSTARFRLILPSPLVLSTACCVLLGMVLRLTFGPETPLWLDETFTGAIAAEPSWQAVVRQIMYDVNAPLYSLIAHGWSLVFGLSNASLRFPALLFGTLAPLACLIPTASLSRRQSLFWCSCVSLWPYVIVFSQEARCYSLLILLSIIGTIAFIRLLETPLTRRAFVWSGIGCLAILTHYQAVFLFGAQGIAFLVLCRREALRTWIAALAFAPAAVWILCNIAVIKAFTAPDVAWYRILTIEDLGPIFAFATVSEAAVCLIVGLAAYGLIRKARAKSPFRSPAPYPIPTLAAVGCSFAAMCLVVGLGFLRPSFTERYLLLFIPGVLLGFVLAVEYLRVFCGLASLFLVLVMTLNCVETFMTASKSNVYNFEDASNALMQAGTTSLVFFWDHPDNLVENPSQLAIVGGFFFKRAGVDVQVKPVKLDRSEDPNPRLLAMASDPKAAILWLFDRHIHDTAAVKFEPRIETLAPDWACKNYGRGAIGVLACTRGARS